MRKRLGLAALAGVSIAAATISTGTIAAAPPPQLEAFLSYPFLTGLTTPEKGGPIAWITMTKGVRNVWLATAPGYTPKRLTAGTLDDGMELSGLTFSPDGRILAWVKGGGEHNEWADGLPPPNPASAVTQPVQEIWVSIDGGAPAKVAEGDAPTLSATGRLAFIKDNQAWTVDPTAKDKPQKLFYDRGEVSDLAWSPDGSKLAFVSHRPGHSFVGICAGADRPLTFLAPSVAQDDDLAWSPDGTRIAFSRREGQSSVLASPLVQKPNPFAIWVADVADGTGKAIWQSPKTLDGSYPQVPDGLFLTWGAGDRIAFRAEMDGWPHLYALPASGGAPKLLTPGDFMVEHVTRTPDRKALVYDANSGGAPGDVDRRHLFRVSLAGGAPQALTKGTGVEFTAAAAADDRIVYVGAGATTPMRLMLADGGKARAIDAAPDYPADKLVTPSPVTFQAADGTTIHGQLFAARGGARHPGLIFVHGGPPRQMLLGWSYMDYYAHAYAMNQYYATHGYTVLSVNYRLGIGYGRAFQHPPHGGIAGNEEYQDVVAGAAYLKAQPGVDANRLAIWGGSYGGLLTAHALAHDSATFKAGVDFHGVHDWSLYPHLIAKPERYEQGDYEAAMKSAFESSPESAIKGWTSPVLLIAGDDDRNVRFDQTIDLVHRLQAQNTPYELLVLPNEIHGFLRYESWLRADEAAVRFLGEKLGR